MLFTIFNTVALESGAPDAFRYQTDDEEFDEFERLVNYYKSKGFFN